MRSRWTVVLMAGALTFSFNGIAMADAGDTYSSSSTAKKYNSTTTTPDYFTQVGSPSSTTSTGKTYKPYTSTTASKSSYNATPVSKSSNYTSPSSTTKPVDTSKKYPSATKSYDPSLTTYNANPDYDRVGRVDMGIYGAGAFIEEGNADNSGWIGGNLSYGFRPWTAFGISGGLHFYQYGSWN